MGLGRSFFSNVFGKPEWTLPTEEARSTAFHFLENYGISKTKNKFELQDGFPYDDARLMLNELSGIMTTDYVLPTCIYCIQHQFQHRLLVFLHLRYEFPLEAK